MSRSTSSRVERGFTLVELLITLVIVSVGILGLAKLQAVAMAETQVSRTRSLMTFQAESLAAVMQSNRGWWASTTNASPFGFTMAAGGAVTDIGTGTGAMDASGAYSSTATTCTTASTPCKVNKKVADWDVTKWASNFSTQFPNATAAVTCTVTAGLPTTCDITLGWSEHYVAMNRTQTSGPSTGGAASSMVLHVQP